MMVSVIRHATRSIRFGAGCAIICVALLGVACAGPRLASTDPSSPAPAGGPGPLVLRIGLNGGFITPAALATRVPDFSMYADGTAITAGGQPAIYPAPALQTLVATRLTAAGIQAVETQAKEAGLGGPNRTVGFGSEPADVPSTVFTFVVGGITHTVTVFGLSEGPGQRTPGPDAQRLSALEGKLMDLRSWLPAGSIASTGAYQPKGLRVLVTPGSAQVRGPMNEPAVTWPLAVPLSTFGTPFSGPAVRCGMVTGGDLAKLLPLAQRATQITPWTSDGHEFSLQFRPLLPDESGC
jgi:hypothetical protein